MTKTSHASEIKLSCSTTKDSCFPLIPTSKNKNVSLDSLIKLYRQKFYIQNFEYIKKLKSLRDYICGNPKHGHQRRMTADTIKKAEKQLISNGFENLAFSSFEELIEEVTRQIGSVKGIGPLAIYDFSLRYGLNHGLAPKDFVYIHQGTATGARWLYQKGYLATRPKGLKLPMDAFPIELQELDSARLEDFLCVMHHHLENIKDKK